MRLAAVPYASSPGDLRVDVRRHVAPPVVHAKRWLHADEVPWFSPGVEPTVVAFGAGRLAPPSAAKRCSANTSTRPPR